MANEITYKANLSVNLNGLKAELKSDVDHITVAGTRFIQSTIALTTTPELIPLGELATVGFAAFRNASTTETIYLLIGTTDACFDKLAPGETHLLRPGTSTPGAKALANTATLQYLICEQ